MRSALSLLWILCFVAPHLGARTPDALSRLPVVVEPDGSFSFHQARLFRLAGVNVLFVRGNSYEMAFQHGRLLAKQIPMGAVPQAAQMFERTVRNGVPQIPLLTPILLNYFKKKYPDNIIEASLRHRSLMQEATGLSEGAGLDLQDVLGALVGPEALQVLVGERLSQTSSDELGAVGTPSSSCSSFAAWGDATADGSLLIGRNTDYPLNGSFDRFPTVIYYNPTDGSLKHMALTSAGLHVSGVVGMNEAGIYIAVHTVPTSQVSTSEIPVFVQAQEVLKHARSFEEALRIFSKMKTSAGWTYLLVSSRERRAASIELSRSGMSVFPATGSHHVQTNHYRSPEKLSEYLHVNLSVDRDTWGRMDRIETLLDENEGEVGEAQAMAILGDKFDPIERQVRSIGNVVAAHTTMTSAVFAPDHHLFYISNGRAPASFGDFVQLSLPETADPSTFNANVEKVFENVSYESDFPHLADAEQEYIRGKMAFESENDPAKALRYVQKAIEGDPSNPAYRFVAAVLALKDSAFDRALKYLDPLLDSSQDHYRRLAYYYQGRIYAHFGDRNAAFARFRSTRIGIDKDEERKLLRATFDAEEKTNRLRRYRINPAMLTLMMQQADMVDY